MSKPVDGSICMSDCSSSASKLVDTMCTCQNTAAAAAAVAKLTLEKKCRRHDQPMHILPLQRNIAFVNSAMKTADDR